MLLFWRLGVEAYRSRAEAHRREVQQQFEKMKIDARAAALTCAAHELRTPVAGILGSAEILVDELADQLPDLERKFLMQIYESSEYLRTLLNDVLDYAKGQAGKISLSIQDVRLPGLVEECISVLRSHAAKRNVCIECEADSSVDAIQGDPLRVKQIILNLLSNAVKYSPTGRPVQVQLGTDGNDVLLSIQDNGKGMRPEAIRHLFEPFYRADDAGSVGTGLGLAIAKSLVELHGGGIAVDSQPGCGTRFTVRLPKQCRMQVERAAQYTWGEAISSDDLETATAG